MPTRLDRVIKELEWAINDIEENGNSEHAGQYVPVLRMAIDMLKEQDNTIKQYKKADVFLSTHGWKWE